MVFFTFAAGIALLVGGAELLVRGASRLAAALGVTPLVIGLTVVAFGTSAPELAVSVKAALAGQSSIAVGNVVGSNIFNVLFILGVSALVAPLVVARQLIRLDVPLMIFLSVLLLVLGLDGSIGRWDGALLSAGMLAYVAFLYFESRREHLNQREPGEPPPPSGRAALLGNVVLAIGGLLLLVVGSRLLVDSAVTTARALGVSDLVIGLTIIAAGTSLPEVVTSVMASIKGERDIAVGNVVGSNIFNIMAVLGAAGLAAPSGLEVTGAALRFDIPVMIAVALACLPIGFTGGVIARWEGALLLGYYVAYTAYLVLAAGQQESAVLLRSGLLYFAAPLTAMTLVVLSAQQALRGRAEARG
ncbi:MAG: calcium/sodium antiporter [Candidatus Hydrogenedens sp.]|nr:calcium/sodium antiporter [Candidatus Hydrogenedens sp.]